MKVKQIIKINKKIDKKLFDFLLKSKPADFGKITSKNLLEIKSRDLLNSLYESDNIFTIYENKKLLAIVFFEATEDLLESSDDLSLQFCYGDSTEFTPNKIIQAFHVILKFAQEKLNKTSISSDIDRENKRRNFINWLKKYDKKCEFFKENNILKIRWKYEKFN
jgi:hypothetical protein